MKPTRAEFLANPKAITLIGMSGVGKSYLSAILAQSGWRCCSCDLLIGESFQAAGHIDAGHRITLEDLRTVSAFIGMLGNPDIGGLDLPEFQHRQQLYYDTECESLKAAAALAAQPGDLVIDSTGSFCEIEDDVLIDAIGRRTLVVYLQASAEDEAEMLERARQYPKPLYFPPQDLRDWLNIYMDVEQVSAVTAIPPSDFARWVFPYLFAARLPKYERLASQYGITVAAGDLKNISNSQSLITYLADQLQA